jgi:hypothetical protein
MIKARGEGLVLLGLSRMNVERLMGDMPIRFAGEEIGLPGITFVIVGGETEQTIADQLGELIGPETKVDDRWEKGRRDG